MKADLHIHSLHSNDGEYSIPEIIDFCIESGVDTFSITDHNSVGGSREAMQLTADIEGVDFIPGIEIDCNYRGTDIHLLGYQVDRFGVRYPRAPLRQQLRPPARKPPPKQLDADLAGQNLCDQRRYGVPYLLLHGIP